MLTLTIFFEPDFAKDMEKKFGHFENPVRLYNAVMVTMENGYLHYVSWDDRAYKLKHISRFYVEESTEDVADGAEA